MSVNPLKITDLTLRDGHQSLLATRMRTEDMTPIASKVNEVGFYSAEVWGGATFDVPTRFLNEDPWERLRKMKKLMPDTPLQMLLRGQNLVGYRHYADDVVSAFVHHAADNGIDIFRVFDALNDERNFETAVTAIKETGKHTQLTISYSLTERTLGGSIFNLEYYLEKAKIFEAMGADSLCVKDMAGLINPQDAYTLISELKKVIKIPIHLHSHFTSGMADMAMLKAIEAGVDGIDTVVAPFAYRSSHPAIEPFVVTLQGSERDTGLDLHKILEIGEYLEKIAPKYRDHFNNSKMSVIDTAVLEHQIPGGMISNLVSQLKEAGALDKLNEVYAEIPRVRKDLGYPPLVTPTSQIVGVQAVQNVLFGRYKVVTGQVKDYMFGLYGKPPVPVDSDIQKQVLKGYERGEVPITSRPADILEPELEKAHDDTIDIAKDMGDTLIYALYPTTGLRFLKWKYGVEAPPKDTKAKTLEDIKKEDELIEKAKSGKLSESSSGAIRNFNVHFGEEVYKVGVESLDGTPVITHIASVQGAATQAPDPKKEETSTSAPAKVEAGDDDNTITAPMPGVIIRYDVKAGDNVKEGDVVAVLEAMKMAIDLPAPVAGKVKAINYKSGDRVDRGDVLAVIE